VKASLAESGRPAAWVPVFADTDDVAGRGQVTVADVTQVRYFVHAKKKAVDAVNKLKGMFGRESARAVTGS
jgi:hypothetical protein